MNIKELQPRITTGPGTLLLLGLLVLNQAPIVGTSLLLLGAAGTINSWRRSNTRPTTYR